MLPKVLGGAWLCEDPMPEYVEAGAEPGLSPIAMTCRFNVGPAFAP